jgi:hypothetical protein
MMLRFSKPIPQPAGMIAEWFCPNGDCPNTALTLARHNGVIANIPCPWGCGAGLQPLFYTHTANLESVRRQLHHAIDERDSLRAEIGRLPGKSVDKALRDLNDLSYEKRQREEWAKNHPLEPLAHRTFPG